VDLVFVYGTLMPGDVAWHRVAPHVVGKPVPSTLRGTLYDTGRGYPALVADPLDDVPGWTLRLRSPDAVLPELDEYEGDEYARVRVVDSGGRPCWTYLWTAPLDGLVRLTGGWAAARR
jgi:gamma-glutamylcyclotransferase (GGCT)/AIG2-like uncharacterized protein YtfP